MKEVQGDQEFLQARHGSPDRNILFGEPAQGQPAYLHDPVQLRQWVGPVIPLYAVWAGASLPDVVQAVQAARSRARDYLVERRTLVRALREMRVGEGDEHLVPLADARSVSVRKIKAVVL